MTNNTNFPPTFIDALNERLLNPFAYVDIEEIEGNKDKVHSYIDAADYYLDAITERVPKAMLTAVKGLVYLLDDQYRMSQQCLYEAGDLLYDTQDGTQSLECCYASILYITAYLYRETNHINEAVQAAAGVVSIYERWENEVPDEEIASANALLADILDDCGREEESVQFYIKSGELYDNLYQAILASSTDKLAAYRDGTGEVDIDKYLANTNIVKRGWYAGQSPEANYWLAMLALTGRETLSDKPEKNFNEAEKCLHEAIGDGFNKANYGIGCMYLYGLKYAQDTETAVEYFKKAVSKGYSIPAMVALGDYYSEIKHDRRAAAAWYDAAAMFDEEAKSKLEALGVFYDKMDNGGAAAFLSFKGSPAVNAAAPRRDKNIIGRRQHIKQVTWDDEPQEQRDPEDIPSAKKESVKSKTPAQVLDEFRDTDGDLKELGPTEYQYALAQISSVAEKEPEAQYWMGLLNCTGSNPDFKVAMNWFSRSLISGFKKANFGLGQLYLHGLGVTKDESAARKCFKAAAAEGYLPAIEAYVECLLNGERENDIELFNLVKEAVEKGSDKLKPTLAKLSVNGNGVEHDYKCAFDIYNTFAQEGNLKYCYELAIMYEQGLGVDVDLDTAERYMGIAASAGDERAQLCVKDKELEQFRDLDGDLKEIDEGDLSSRRKIESLAESFPEAMYWKGLLNLGKNNSVAFNCIKQASDDGFIKADGALSQMYSHGMGVTADAVSAEKYKLSSESFINGYRDTFVYCSECGARINPNVNRVTQCTYCGRIVCGKCYNKMGCHTICQVCKKGSLHWK